MKESFEPLLLPLRRKFFYVECIDTNSVPKCRTFIFREKKLSQGFYVPTTSYIPPASQKSMTLCSDKDVFDLTSEEQVQVLALLLTSCVHIGKSLLLTSSSVS